MNDLYGSVQIFQTVSLCMVLENNVVYVSLISYCLRACMGR